MEFNRKNVRMILLIIAFAVVLYTAAQNLASVYGAVKTVWNVFGVVITGLAMAFVLNVPLKLFEDRVFYGMSEDRRPLGRAAQAGRFSGLRAGRQSWRHSHPHSRRSAPAHPDRDGSRRQASRIYQRGRQLDK